MMALRKSFRVAAAGVFLLGVFTTGASWADELWKLDLEGQQVGAAPTFGEGLEIREEEGRKMLVKIEGGTQFFPNNVPTAAETAGWNDIVYKVRFRESERFGMNLVVKASGQREGERYLWYYIAIQPDQIVVTCHGLKDSALEKNDPRLKSSVKFKDIGEAPLQLGDWITVEASVGNEVIKVSVDNGDGGNRKGEFATLPGAGGVKLLALGPVDVSTMEVQQSKEPVERSK